MTARDELYFRMDSGEALERLESRATGLTRQEASERRERFGENKIEDTAEAGVWRIVLEQFTDPLIYILLIAAVITALLGEYTDTYVIVAVVLVNAVIGFSQEYKAEKAISALADLTAPTSRVVRGRGAEVVDSRELVPGDIVLLSSGDRVPADLRLLETTLLEIDESALTGESLGVRKDTEKIEEKNPPLSDRKNLAFMGTVVLSGRGRGVVFATGSATEIGKISEKVKTVKQAPTPLQVQFAQMGRLIGIVVIALSLVAFFGGLLAGLPSGELLLTAIALAVAAIPEGLPVVFTLTLAVGVSRMAKRNAIVRRLPAVETLGSCSIIASDKTGTLTKNQMTVQRILAGDEHFCLSGTGFDPSGKIFFGPEKKAVAAGQHKALHLCLLAGTLANESELVFDKEKGFTGHGDPTETALHVSALKGGLSPGREREQYAKIDEIPFESEKFYMATLHRLADSENKLIFVKGAPDRVLEMCGEFRMDGHGHNVPLDRTAVLEQYKDMGSEGLRVLAMACRELKNGVDKLEPGLVEQGLTFLGLQGMLDPPREEAVHAVRESQKAGIRVMMVTGDHEVTAEAIARKIGIAGADSQPVLAGREIDSISDEELNGRLAGVAVCARVSPLNKLRIIEQLIKRGEVVAVTGDGVNDAPALKAAHIGVAMGKAGTDVAKETSDMIITDDNFASIFAAVEEGRVVYANLRKATSFLLSTGAGTILLILLSLALGYPIPFRPAQILWLNLVTNGLQDVALAFEPGEEGILDYPPRDPGEPIISRLIRQRLLLVGLILMAGTFFNFWWQLQGGASLDQARSVALTTMVMFQMFHVFNSRSELKSIFRTPLLSNRFLFASVIAAFSAHLAVLYLPQLRAVFRTTPLAAAQWVVIAAVASSVILGVEIEKAFRRKARKGK